MLGLFSAFEWALLGPVLIGCIYSLLCLGAVREPGIALLVRSSAHV